jgi:hypothetical protein
MAPTTSPSPLSETEAPTTSPSPLSPTDSSDRVSAFAPVAVGSILVLAFVAFCYCTYRSKSNKKEKKRLQAQMELQTFNRMAETSR